MGRGTSKAGGGSGGTPSGVTYQQFMQMSDAEKNELMATIVADNSIKVPDYLDDSVASKVIYALGMDGKPNVVSDAQLDAMQGRELFRTVYESGSMPPPTSDAVLDQIMNGDYTQLSGKGGSYHGRAIYFATDFDSSASYGYWEDNPRIMRAKINSNANIRSEDSLTRQMSGDSTWNSHRISGVQFNDQIALYALSHGVDGWYSGSYTMMVNRGALTASSTTKSIWKSPASGQSMSNQANSWQEAGGVQ